MEITKNDAATAGTVTPLWYRVIGLGLAVTVYFLGLNVPFIGPDESRYAQVAREMYERGDWLTPTLGGHTWFEKPPLLYWLEIISYHIVGVNEFAARLGPALCGLAIAAVLFAVEKTYDRKPGLLAVMTAATVGLIAFSHTAGFDIVLTLALTCAMVSFWKADLASRTPGEPSALRLASFYVFTGLAILSKGLIGLLFPFVIVLLFYAVSRRLPPRSVAASVLWGFPLLLLIAAPWHIAMYLRHGSEFVDLYFIQHHFERFITNKYLHPQPFYFFWWVLPVLALPWTPIALAAVIRNVKQRKSSSSLFVLSLCWLVVPLVFFSFSGSKLPGYILPAAPPLVIIAWLWLREKTSAKWRVAAMVLCLGTLTASVVIIAAFLPAFAAHDSVKGLIAAADARGYSTNRVLTLHMVSYNAEFYAGERLVKDSNGEQVRLEGAQLVLDEVNKEGRPMLVLVPVEYASQLTDYSRVDAEILSDNGRVAIVSVAAR